MKATLWAIGTIGILTTTPGDCSVDPAPSPSVPEGRLYLVDGNGDEWPVVSGTPGTGIYFYMEEFDWTVSASLIQPHDPRYTQPWQYTRMAVPRDREPISVQFPTPGCQGEPFWLIGAEQCVDAQAVAHPDPATLPWQPVSPFGYFDPDPFQLETNGVSGGTVLRSAGYWVGNYPEGGVQNCEDLATPVDFAPSVLCGIRRASLVDDWQGVPPEPYVLKFDRL